jgi:hypothetical protein
VLTASSAKSELERVCGTLGANSEGGMFSKLILSGAGSLRKAPTEFQEHFHHERNHRGKGNVVLFPGTDQAHVKVAGRFSAARGSVAFSGTTIGGPHEFLDQTGTEYREIGGDYFDRLHPERTRNRHVRRLQRLGLDVQLYPRLNPTPPPPKTLTPEPFLLNATQAALACPQYVISPAFTTS